MTADTNALTAALAAGATRRDDTGVLSADDVTLLAALRQSHPVGTVAARREIAQEVRALARLDPGAAQIVADHHSARALAGTSHSGLDGWYTHTDGPQIRRTPHPDGLLLDGVARLSATGRLATWVVIPNVGVLPTDSAGITVTAGAPAFGQRTTAGADIHLDRVFVPAADPLPGDSGWRAFDEALQTAVDVGTLDAFLDAAKGFLLGFASPWHESGAAKASADPHVIGVFGQAYAQARALRLLFGQAIEGFDQRAVTLARWYAYHRIGKVINSVIGVLGASGTAGRFAHDRYWRDFRTHALRQPPYWSLSARPRGTAR